MANDALVYYSYRLAGALASHLPVRAGYALASGIGSLVYRISRARPTVQENISHVLAQPADSPAVRRVTHRIFQNQAKNYFDLLRLSGLRSKDIQQAAYAVRGREHIEQALARGRGVILVSGHFGDFELAAQVVALNGVPVTVAAEHLRPERLFNYLRRLRESHGIRLVPIDALLRPLFRALRTNGIVGLAIDRNVSDAGRPVQFFGQPARMPDGYLRLARHTGAALIVAFCRRLPDNRFEISIEPEIQLDWSGDLEHDLAAGQRRVIAIFERYLRRDPDQWVYFQPVWTQANATGERRVTESTSVREETGR